MAGAVLWVKSIHSKKKKKVQQLIQFLMSYAVKMCAFLIKKNVPHMSGGDYCEAACPAS